MTTTTFKEGNFLPRKHILLFIYNTLTLKNFNLVVTKANFIFKKKMKLQMHEEQKFNIPKTLLFDELNVNIWGNFYGLKRKALIIALYNI